MLQVNHMTHQGEYSHNVIRQMLVVVVYPQEILTTTATIITLLLIISTIRSTQIRSVTIPGMLHGEMLHLGTIIKPNHGLLDKTPVLGIHLLLHKQLNLVQLSKGKCNWLKSGPKAIVIKARGGTHKTQKKTAVPPEAKANRPNTRSSTEPKDVSRSDVYENDLTSASLSSGSKRSRSKSSDKSKSTTVASKKKNKSSGEGT